MITSVKIAGTPNYLQWSFTEQERKTMSVARKWVRHTAKK